MKYQIVLVPFPFDDFSGTKVRPIFTEEEKQIVVGGNAKRYRVHAPEFIALMVTQKILSRKDAAFAKVQVRKVLKNHSMIFLFAPSASLRETFLVRETC